MAFDGNGNYLRVHNWTQDAANGIDINAGEMDGEDNSIASALSICVTRDGQGKMTASFLPSSDNTLNLGTGGARWATLNGVAVGAYQTNLQSAAEVAAGVTPTNLQYSTSPHDIRRYGALMDGVTDDSAAWAKLALVMAKGGNGYVPPGDTLKSSNVVFHGATTPVELTGYGCRIFTGGAAVDGFTAQAFSSGGMTVRGLTVMQRDAAQTAGFNQQGLHSSFVDCLVLVSGVTQANASYGCFKQSTFDNTTTAFWPLWNRFLNCKVQQDVGNVATYAPYGFLNVGGGGGVTRINGCDFQATSYGVGILNDAGASTPAALAQDINIVGNSFDVLGSAAIIVNGNTTAATQISGLVIRGNYFESVPTALLLQGLAANSNVPTVMADNYFVSSVTNYISQSNVAALQVIVNSYDLSITPSYTGMANLRQNATWNYFNSGAGDVINVITASNSGFGLSNSSGTLLAALRLRSGGGAFLNGPTSIDIEGIDGLSHSPGVRRKTFTGTATFAASTTVTVTITAEPDTNYMIYPEPNPTTGAITVSSKTTTTFILTAASSNSQTIPFMLIGR